MPRSLIKMKARRRLRDEPATFWMGVALVSEAPVLGFGHWLLHYHCIAGPQMGCNLSLPLLGLGAPV